MPPSLSRLSVFFQSAAEKLKKPPSFLQSRNFWRLLTVAEKRTFMSLGALAIISFSVSLASFYFSHTIVVAAPGGSFKEGLVGQPRFLNPVLAPVSDVDRDLTELLFAGLFKYSAEGEILPDLAEGYQVLEDGEAWEVSLKENLFFQDGSPLTTDDVIFTIKTIQNPDYKSPLRPAWLGVEMEKISDRKVIFRLKNAYPAFLESLTLKILPKAPWQDISADNFALANLNLQPIGSGPFRVGLISSDKNGQGFISFIKLEINSRYHGLSPKVQSITFFFFETETDLLKEVRKKTLDNYAVSPSGQNTFPNGRLYRFQLPRYFALFFNGQNSSPLTDPNIRRALNYATDKKEIVDGALNQEAVTIDSPLLDDLFGFAEPGNALKFDLAKANDLLDKAGFKMNTQTSIRKKTVKNANAFQFKSRLSTGSQGTEVKELQKCLAKEPGVYPNGEITGSFGGKTKQAVILFQEKYAAEILTPAGLTEGSGEVGELTRKKLNALCASPTQELLSLKFSLLTVDDPLLLDVARLLQAQWQKVGVELQIQSFSFNQLSSDYLRPRNYEILLFGEALARIPDYLPFWHSLQKKDPGLNLTAFASAEADKLLVEARQSQDEKVRQEKYEKFQTLLLGNFPAVFLYRPYFLYIASPKLKGVANDGFIVDPSQRFAGITDWYLKTKRVWK